MSLKQLLKNVWFYSLTIIVPLAILASFMDLLMLGGIRLFLAIITHSWDFISRLYWLKNLGIAPWIVIMLTIIAIRYLVISLRMRSEERLSHRLEGILRAWLVRTINGLHPLQFHKIETKGALHNANHAVSEIPKGCRIVTQSVQAISQLLFFVPVLFILSWQLTIVLLFIFTPILLYLQNTFKKTGKNIDDVNQFSGDYDSNLWRWAALRKCWNNRAELSAYLTLIFSKIRNLRNVSTTVGVRDVTIMQNIETLSIFIMCIVLAVCAGLIRMGVMEPFQIVLFCAALFICYKPIKDCSQLFSGIRVLRVAYAGLNRLEYMDNFISFFEEGAGENVKIENMAFRYGNNQPWVFQAYNIDIKTNRPIILQGENGSGKTTLLRILSGLEIPQDGCIYMPPKSKNGSFFLSQRLFFPPISWLEKTINEKGWSENIRHFFDVLDLQNLFKKHGHSNGELQRIGLAWAIASEMPMLFLDEPFAFVSQDMREPVFKAFWNATIETDQWWIMASHILPPQAYQDRLAYIKL